jgi:hypothetical protein
VNLWLWILVAVIALAMLADGGPNTPRKPKDPLQRMREGGCL